MSIGGLLARSLDEISVGALFKRALWARSPQGTSWQERSKSLRNVSVQDAYKRSLGKICFVLFVSCSVRGARTLFVHRSGNKIQCVFIGFV